MKRVLLLTVVLLAFGGPSVQAQLPPLTKARAWRVAEHAIAFPKAITGCHRLSQRRFRCHLYIRGSELEAPAYPGDNVEGYACGMRVWERANGTVHARLRRC